MMFRRLINFIRQLFHRATKPAEPAPVIPPPTIHPQVSLTPPREATRYYIPRPGHAWNPLRKRRNMKCICDSGKKVKHCCGQLETVSVEDAVRVRMILKLMDEGVTADVPSAITI